MANQEMGHSPGDKPGIFYGYIIAIVAFFIMFVFLGTYGAFGVFFKPILTEFGWTRAMTSGAFSLSLIIGGLLGVIAGRLTDKFGPRPVMTGCGFLLALGYLLMSQINSIWQLYLFFGIIIGIGMAGVWISMMSTIARWFVRRRSLMTGLVVAGVGIGGLIGPLVANHLISIYDWRTAYITLGITVLITVIPAAQFLRRAPTQEELIAHNQNENKENGLESDTKSLSFHEAVHTRQFWLFTTMVFCFGFCLFAIRVHIAPHATELGFSSATAATVLAAIGGVGIIGNATLGSTGDRLGNRQVFIISFILMAASLFWLLPAVEVWNLYLFAGVFGIARGGLDSVESPLIAELFGLESHGLIYGVITLGFTIGGAMGPVIAGYIFDVTGSYQLAFLISAFVATAGFILAATLRPIKGTYVQN
ncbi:MFS transporter [Chloroflexota bacterium]